MYFLYLRSGNHGLFVSSSIFHPLARSKESPRIIETSFTCPVEDHVALLGEKEIAKYFILNDFLTTASEKFRTTRPPMTLIATRRVNIANSIGAPMENPEVTSAFSTLSHTTCFPELFKVKSLFKVRR